MTEFSRYAIYYAPARDGALAAFGARWLGWDADEAAPAPHPEVSGLPAPLAEITATPRKYGFHGTLKPPFRVDGSPDAMIEAAAALAARLAPFDASPLRLMRFGGFLALAPSAHSTDLADLAFACVRDLDPFRAPPDAAELARRRAKGLTERQEALLSAWGYPYVGPEFQFHLTLSGKLSEDDAKQTEAVLAPLVAPLCAAPLPMREIAVFGEADDGFFRVIRRLPLTG